MFRAIWERKRTTDLLLVFGIGLISLVHTSLEKTLYYWDFGDYQRNLIQLHLAAQDGVGTFFSQLWEFQNSEYPVSWAGPLALFPLLSFTNRALFTIFLSIVGIYLWAKSTQILTFKIFKSKDLPSLALVLLCCSTGPWMLSLRGWPDVIACGLIWFGFAKSFETKQIEEFIWSLILILLGIVMRKTTLDLGFCLTLISFVSVAKPEFFHRLKDFSTKSKMIFSLQLLLIFSWLAVNPGFIESVLMRNNRDFYKPFQVTFKEYINNLVAMNGSIYLFLSLISVVFLLIYGFRQRRYGLIGLGLFPFLFTAIWMALFKQATDHHMVQWVPTIGTLGIVFILKYFTVKIYWSIVSKASIAVGLSLLLIVLAMPQTPFASPSNAFARPFAHSIAPIQRPDISNLSRLEKTLIPFVLAGKSIVSLNESHEFNQGTLKAMFQNSNFMEISLLPIGTMDYRDDPGFRNFFDADYILVPDPYLPIIPEYQRTLMQLNSEFSLTGKASGFWLKKDSFQIGDISSSSTWWSVDYAKKQTEISLYKRVSEIPEDYRRNFVRHVYANTQSQDTKMADLQLVSGGTSSRGASLANNSLVTVELTSSSTPATVYVKAWKVNFDSTCKFSVKFDDGRSLKVQPGKSSLSAPAGTDSFMTLMPPRSDANICKIRIYPSSK